MRNPAKVAPDRPVRAGVQMVSNPVRPQTHICSLSYTHAAFKESLLKCLSLSLVSGSHVAAACSYHDLVPSTAHARCMLPIMEERIMNKAISTLAAAAAALALSSVAYAQNNTLATPSVTSPVAAAAAATNATNGYGTPGATNSDSGTSAGSSNSGAQSANSGAAADTAAYGANNTLARPSVASPVK
jgi:hypothetical protein